MLADTVAPSVSGDPSPGGTQVVDADGNAVQWQKLVDPDGTADNGDDVLGGYC